jgi:nitrite reductase/ring-hydroxylating ferredoxin subunit
MGEARARRRVLVGSRAELTDGTQRIISIDDATEVGVIAHNGELYSYENRCSHQGGPVCEGTVIGLVEPRLGSDGEMLGERFSDSEPHLVCPWHGVEFRLLTGECVTIPGARLRRYALEVDHAGDVFLLVGEDRAQTTGVSV